MLVVPVAAVVVVREVPVLVVVTESLIAVIEKQC